MRRAMSSRVLWWRLGGWRGESVHFLHTFFGVVEM